MPNSFTIMRDLMPSVRRAAEQDDLDSFDSWARNLATVIVRDFLGDPSCSVLLSALHETSFQPLRQTTANSLSQEQVHGVLAKWAYWIGGAAIQQRDWQTVRRLATLHPVLLDARRTWFQEAASETPFAAAVTVAKHIVPIVSPTAIAQFDGVVHLLALADGRKHQPNYLYDHDAAVEFIWQEIQSDHHAETAVLPPHQHTGIAGLVVQAAKDAYAKASDPRRTSHWDDFARRMTGSAA